MTDTTFWHKQAGKPLYPDMMWSRPENKRQAGKLLIVGGQAQSFSAPAAAYTAANKAGIGTARVLLPNSTQKLLGKVFPETEFALSTPSGSFSRAALDSWLDLASWSDGVLVAGDLGKNSETAVLLETFMRRYSGPVILAGDSLDYFIESDSPLVKREETIAVMELSRLQKLSVIDVESHLVLHRMDLLELVKVLHEWTGRDPGVLVTVHQGQVIIATSGQVSTTASPGVDLTELAAYLSVWRLQQPAQVFEALTCAAYECLASGAEPDQSGK